MGYTCGRHGCCPRDILWVLSTGYIRCCPRDIKCCSRVRTYIQWDFDIISRGRHIDMAPRCRFRCSPVDYTHPVDFIPWSTFCIPWVHPVDTAYPVGVSRGLHISRGYDIPWTTCVHGTKWVLSTGCISRGCIPWTRAGFADVVVSL